MNINQTHGGTSNIFTHIIVSLKISHFFSTKKLVSKGRAVVTFPGEWHSAEAVIW